MTARHLPVIDIDAPNMAREYLTRADCESAPRPCPLLTCQFHLGVTITNAGHMRLHPSLADIDIVTGLRRMKETCVLDVVGDGKSHEQHEVAELMGTSQQAVSLDEVKALAKARTCALGDG